MNRSRDYYRHQRNRCIARKKNITKHYWSSSFHSYYPYEGMYSKNKIHCSCYMCRHKSYDELSMSDKRALERVSYIE